MMVPILAGTALALTAPARADVQAGVDTSAQVDAPSTIPEWEAAAAQGDAEALYNLGQAYRLGYGVPPDLIKAEEFFGKAAAQGHEQAADNYGVLLYQRGDSSGALPYLIAATARGDASAQYMLGVANFEGDGVPEDWIRAYALLTLARQGGLAQADTVIAQMDERIPLYEREKGAELASQLGAEIDLKRARQLTEGAADSGLDVVKVEIVTPPSMDEPLEMGTVSPMPSMRPAPADPAMNAAPSAGFAPAPAPAPVAAPEPASTSSWRVQLGAFGVRANADSYWNKLKDRPEIAGRQRINIGTGRVRRLLAGGFASEEEAKVACSRLAADGFGCFIVGN